MKLQLLPPSFPPPDAHQERAAWARGAGSARGWRAVLGCSWTYRMVKGRCPLLGSLIPFGVPTLRLLPLPLRRSSTSPPQTFLPLLSPWLFAGDSRADGCSQTPWAPFSWAAAEGNSTRAPAEQGRGPGALSGYNLGTINRGSEGSRFLFSFYPLQCLC